MNREFRDIENFAVSTARRAGQIILKYFQEPLVVEYKSKQQTNPVTDADKRSEEYIKEAILKEYPSHSIVAEEGSEVDSSCSDFIWVVDPLDGTVNFINGLPIFAVSIGVLYKGKPTVGSIFIPSYDKGNGIVFHARTGGGAFRDDRAICVSQDLDPRRGRVSIFPASVAKSFRFKGEFKNYSGELRSLGSVAYELAMTASGVIQYSIFGSPWVWDVAAGIVLVTEANGGARFRRQSSSNWEIFRGFDVFNASGLAPNLKDLKNWRTSWIFGGNEMINYVTDHLVLRSSFDLMRGRILRNWIR